jgi:hypothetical protein
MPNPKGTPANLKPLGRPKGCKNKFTDLKNDILRAYKELGGVEYLKLLKEPNFIRLISDLLPKKIEAEHSGAVGLTVKIVKFAEGKNEVKKNEN